MILIIFLTIITIYAVYFIRNNGWNQLIPYFKTDETVTGSKIKYISMGIGKAIYRNSVLLTYSSNGLFMEIMGPLGRLYPKLFIPWRAIKYNHDKNPLSFSRYELIIGDPKITTFIVNNQTYCEIKDYIN